MGEPSTTGPTSAGGGLHDDGDPGMEEMWDATMMSSSLVGANMLPTGDVLSSTAQGPPTAAEQVPSVGASTAEAVLERPVRAWQKSRRASLPSTAVVLEEIVRDPTPPPQLLHTVIQHREEFEMLEEREASSEAKKLRTDLTSMVAHIEVSLRDFLEKGSTNLFACCRM